MNVNAYVGKTLTCLGSNRLIDKLLDLVLSVGGNTRFALGPRAGPRLIYLEPSQPHDPQGKPVVKRRQFSSAPVRISSGAGDEESFRAYSTLKLT